MAMLTTCPACHTRFRVTPELLGAHGGEVRCGRCAKVFNAHAYLEYEAEGLEAEKESGDRPKGVAGDVLPPKAKTSPRKVKAPPQAVAAEPLLEDFSESLAGEAAFAKRRSVRWLWLLGALLLLASLAGQGLYFFRSELASRYPDLKPTLQEFCRVLQCSIRLPANPDLISIETSNLEADPEQGNLVVLNAILRNRAAFAQEYPLLELTLTDTMDQTIARRVFPPGDYARKADLKRGMPPNEEVTVKLHLDLGELKAAGYRVFLFYPQ